jgi:hypothetical protein
VPRDVSQAEADHAGGQAGRTVHPFRQADETVFRLARHGDKPEENEDEMKALDVLMKEAGLKRIHTSYISEVLGVAAIWAR